MGSSAFPLCFIFHFENFHLAIILIEGEPFCSAEQKPHLKHCGCRTAIMLLCVCAVSGNMPSHTLVLVTRADVSSPPNDMHTNLLILSEWMQAAHAPATIDYRHNNNDTTMSINFTHGIKNGNRLRRISHANATKW